MANFVSPAPYPYTNPVKPVSTTPTAPSRANAVTDKSDKSITTSGAHRTADNLLVTSS